MTTNLKTPAKPVKKGKRPAKFKSLAKDKVLVSVVTVTGISPV